MVNPIRLSGTAHGIVSRTVHKTLPGGGGGGCLGGASRCHLIDRLPKVWLLHLYWLM